MSVMKFHLLLYEDEHFCKLKENWMLQIHVYEGVYAVAKPEQKTKFKISIPETALTYSRSSKIHLHSNCSDLIFQD